MRYYCKIILEYCSFKTGDDVLEDSRQIPISYRSLQFDKVQANIKRNFPITEPVASDKFGEHLQELVLKDRS